MPRPTRRDYEKLLEFRVALRRFQRWSEDQAQAVGLTHVQHQLLVAIKGHPGDLPPTIGELAGYLLQRPHSTVELVDRAEAAGLVERIPDPHDGRVVRVQLSEAGDGILEKLTPAHLARLEELAVVLDELVAQHGGRVSTRVLLSEYYIAIRYSLSNRRLPGCGISLRSWRRTRRTARCPKTLTSREN